MTDAATLLAEQLARLEELAGLKDGWIPGGKGVDARSLLKARGAILVLSESRPFITANWAGHIVFEWERDEGGLDVHSELEFNSGSESFDEFYIWSSNWGYSI